MNKKVASKNIIIRLLRTSYSSYFLPFHIYIAPSLSNPSSFDMRNDLSGRHWMDRRAFGDRASFHIGKTEFKTRAGVPIYKAYLRVEQVRF